MKVLVNGLPFFSTKLVADLNEFDANNHYLFLNTYESLWAKIKFFLFLPFYDKVISMNGVSDKSGSLNWVVKWKKPLLMLWQGTDVLIAMERYQNKTLYTKYINYSTLYAVAPWLVDELNSIKIKADVLSFLWLTPNTEKIEKPQNFACISYLGKGREDFYGWEIIKAAAQELKDVKFYIVGSDGEKLESTKNIEFSGWLNQEEMQKIYAKSSVYIRIPEHDGYAHFIGEALSKGLDVIWKYPHPMGYVASNKEQLIQHINLLKSKFDINNGERNQKNIDWVKVNLERNKVLQNIVNQLKEL